MSQVKTIFSPPQNRRMSYSLIRMTVALISFLLAVVASPSVTKSGVQDQNKVCLKNCVHA
ncbi:MAG: hypothetical protein KA436_03975 [Oligoflexales bacterium]|nr:hypothetical protein [Oligoflexales bacterium]